MFIIEDAIHAEYQDGEFTTFTEALTEVQRRAVLPWNEPPNVAPCTGWVTCGRAYVIIEYDASSTPWKELQRIPALEIGAAGIKWLYPDPEGKEAEGADDNPPEA